MRKITKIWILMILGSIFTYVTMPKEFAGFGVPFTGILFMLGCIVFFIDTLKGE